MLYIFVFFSCYIFLFLNERVRLPLFNQAVNFGVLASLAFLAGGRSIYVGSDVITYSIDHFNFSLSYCSFSDLWDKRILEFGYEFENFLVTRFTSDIHWELFLNSLTVMVGLYFGSVYWSKKLSIPFSLIILFFLFTAQFNTSLNVIRQYMAVSTLFGFSQFFFERKFFFSLIGIILAYLFHDSGLIGFFIYFLYSKELFFHKRLLVIFFVSFVFLFPIGSSLAIEYSFLPQRFYRYFSNVPLDIGGPLLSISKLTYVFIAYICFKKTKDRISFLFLVFSVFCFVFCYLKTLFGAVYRLSFYFDIFLSLFIVYSSNILFTKSNRVLYLFTVMILFLVLFLYMIPYKNYGDTYPFVWDGYEAIF